MKKKSIFLGLALATVAVVSLSSCKFFDQKKTTTKTTPTTTVIPTTTGTDPITTGTTPTTTVTDPVTTGTTPTTTVTDPVTTGTTPITTGTDPVTTTEVTPTTTTIEPEEPTVDVLTPEEEDDFEGYIQIKSISDFLSFRDDAEANVNKNAILLCDIDLEGYVLEDAAIQMYSGIFNGRGHAIKNAVLNLSGNKCGLLFKSVNDGMVTNTRFVGCTVNGGNAQGIGLVTGLAGGNSKFTKLEFNACSVIGGSYVGFITGEANEVKVDGVDAYGAAMPLTFSEITVKNNSSTTGVQYGGILVGDVNAKATIKMSDLDIKGSFKGSSGNGSFMAGRCRAGCTIEISNAIIDAEKVETPTKNGVLTGGGTQAITLKTKNVYIKNAGTATLGGNNKEENITLSVDNCYYNATNAASAAQIVTNGTTPSGFESVATDVATADWLEETLGLDFEEVWTKEGDGLYRLQAASTNVKSADATLAKITLATGAAKLRYHKDDTFSEDGLVVFATYSDGVQLVVTGFEASGYDMSTAGAQEVTISYTEGEVTKTAVMDIMVAEQTGFVIDDSFMVKTYVTGQDLDVKNLLVYSQWSDNVLEKLGTKEYTVDSAAFDKTQAGEYTLKISNSTFEAQDVVVTVIDTKPVVVDNYVYVNVSKDATADGELVNGVETFKSVTAAINYLTACKYDSKVNKVIYVAPGTYEEKIDTSLDNLHLIGTSANYNDTIITYSAVESTKNPLTEAPYSLNAVDCATVHVNGTGFEAANISIRNDFDYIANTQTNAESSPQGLALTVNGDGAVLYNVHLYGNQDTLYLKSGRTYCKSCLIEGNVDFIFGQDTGIALFEDCTINAVYRGETNNTGYVTAMKVQSADAKPEFGYVFLNCNLTADANVKDGSMSLGRPWGQYATVAYIGCTFSKAYSKLAYDGAAKSRWFDMSGASPVNADFAEYNSQGDGGITEAVAGGKILTSEQADRYIIANILAQENGTAPKFSLAVNFVQELQELMAEAQGTEATTAIYALNETGDQISVQLAVQAEVDLGVFVRNWNANNKVVEAEIADDTVVSYNNGVIKGLAGGSTTITLKQGELTAVVTVNVVDAEIWTVTFNTDGTEVEEQSIVDGYTIDATAITTTKEGAVFKGWYKDDKFEEAFDVVNDVIKADTVLYARFVDYADLALENFTMYLDGTEGDGINTFKAPTVDGEKNDINLQGKTEDAPGIVYALNVWGAKLQSRYDVEGTTNTDCQFNANTYISFKVNAYATVTVTYRSNTSATLSMGETELATLTSAQTFSAQVNEAGVVKLSQTANGYITKIEVSYPTYIKENTVLSKDADSSKANNYVLTNDLDFTSTPFELTGTLGAHSSGAVQFAQNTAISFGVKKNATVSIDVFDASYGQFDVYVNKVLSTDLNSSTGDYQFQVTEDALIEIKCKNVGTDESPAYNKSYLYGVAISYPQVIIADTVLSNTASSGENSYVLTNDLDFSTTPFELTSTLGAHSSGAVQFGQNTVITFYVKENATVSIDVFDASYGQFDVYVDGTLSTDLDATTGDYKFKVDADSKIEIKCKNVGTDESPAYNQSYLYGISVAYIEEVPVEPVEYTYNYTSETNTGWTMNGNGTCKSADDPAITVAKLVYYDYYLDLVLTEESNKVTIDMTGFTTGSSSAKDYVAVILYDNAGNKITEITGTTGTDKKNAVITFAGATSVTYESETAIAKIRITGNTDGKSVGITTVKVVAE